MQNPYSPPEAAIAAPAPAVPAMERPREVKWAIILVYAGILVGWVSVALSWEYYARLQEPATFLASQVISFAVSIWFYGKIYAGRNWARITWLVLGLLTYAVMPLPFWQRQFALMPLPPKVAIAIGLAIFLAVSWLLFFSPGKEWFRKVPRIG